VKTARPCTHDEWILLLQQSAGANGEHNAHFNLDRNILDIPQQVHIAIADYFVSRRRPRIAFAHFLCYAVSDDEDGHVVGREHAETDFRQGVAAASGHGDIYGLFRHLGLSPGNRQTISRANSVAIFLLHLLAYRKPENVAVLLRETVFPVYERSVLPAALANGMSSYVARFAEECLKIDPCFDVAKDLFLANNRDLILRREKTRQAWQTATARQDLAGRNGIPAEFRQSWHHDATTSSDPSGYPHAWLAGPYGDGPYLRRIPVSDKILSLEIQDPARRKADRDAAPVRYSGLRHQNRILLDAMRRIDGFRGMRDLAAFSGVSNHNIRENINHLVKKRMVFFGKDWYGLHPSILPQVEEHMQSGMAARTNAGSPKTLLRPLAQSDHEGVIYGILSELLVCGFVVNMQTSVRAIFDNTKMKRFLDEKEYEYFKTCYLDYCIAPAGSFLPVLSIEVDSVLHDNPRAKWRDDTKDKILRIGGLSGVRIRPEDYFTRESLKQRISSVLAGMRSHFFLAGEPGVLPERTPPSSP